MRNGVNDINWDDKSLEQFKHLSKKEIQRIVAEKFEYFSSLIKYSKNAWLTMKPFQPTAWEEWTFACGLWEEWDKYFQQYMQWKIKFSDIPEEYFEPKYLYYWLPWIISKDNDVLWPIIDHELEHAESSDYWDMLVNSREAVEHNLPVTTVGIFFNAFEDIYMGKKQIAKWRAKKLWVQNLYKDMFTTTWTIDARWSTLKLNQFANKVLYYRLTQEFPLSFDVDYVVDDDVQEEFDNFIAHLDEIVDVNIDNKERLKKKNEILWPIIERLWEKDMDNLQRQKIKEQIQQERKAQQTQQAKDSQQSTQKELSDTLTQQPENNWENQEIKEVQDWTQEALKDTLDDRNKEWEGKEDNKDWKPNEKWDWKHTEKWNWDWDSGEKWKWNWKSTEKWDWELQNITYGANNPLQPSQPSQSSSQKWSDKTSSSTQESTQGSTNDSQLEKAIEDRLNNMSDEEKKQLMEDIKDEIDSENLKEHWDNLRMQKKLLDKKEDWESKKQNLKEKIKEMRERSKKKKQEEQQEKDMEEMQKQWEAIENAVEGREKDLEQEKELNEYLDQLEWETHEKNLDKMDNIEKEYERLGQQVENIESEDVKQRLKDKIKAMSEYLKKKEKEYEDEMRKSGFSREEEYLYRRYMKLEKELSKDVDRFIKKLEAEIPKLKEYHLEWWYSSWRVTDMNEAWRKIRLKQRWEKLYSRLEEKESLEVNLWICLSVDVSGSMSDNMWETMKLVIFLWLLCQKWWIPFHVNTFWDYLNIIKDTDDDFETQKWRLMRELVADGWSTNISVSVQKDLDVIKEVKDTHPDTVFLPIFITDWWANRWITWYGLIELMKWFKWLSTIVGIGINENELKSRYPNSKVIWLRNSSEIMTVLLRELRQFFKKHKAKIFKVVNE